MYTIYHYYLCPSSRFVRLILEEHKVIYNVQLENYWKPQKDFLKINPAGHLPILINEENHPIIGANACLEYIKDLKGKYDLFAYPFGHNQSYSLKVKKLLHDEGIKYAFTTSSKIIEKNSDLLALGRAPMLNFDNKDYVLGSAYGAFHYWDKILQR